MLALDAVRRLGPHALATVLANALYGTISTSVVITVLDGDAEGPGEYVARAGSTAVVLWMAHLYAHWLGAAIVHNDMGRRAFLREALLSSPVALVAVPLLVPIALSSTRIWSLDTGTEISTWVTLAALAASGLLLARRRRASVRGTIGLIVRCAFLGVVLVVMEELVH